MGQLETGIKDKLLATSSITAIVSTRIRPIALAKVDDRPCITYNVTNRKSNGFLDGSIADYHNAEFELGIYGDTYADVMDISDAARAALDQYGGTTSNVEFAPIIFDQETDVEEVTPEGQELPVYLRVQTYRTLYKITA